MTGHIYKKKRPAAGASEEEVRVIMHDGDASSSVTSESDHGSDPPGGRFHPVGTFRHSLDKLLHSNRFQILVVSLVVVNCLVVIVQLLIDMRILELQSGSHTAARVLYYLNIVILSLFVLEMGAKFLAFGLRFFRHRMELFDLAVVVLAFSLCLALGGHEKSADGVSLLIMLRLWRVTKILNSIVASVKQEADRKLNKERRARRALEREVAKLREYCLQQECELQMYRLMLEQNGIAQPTLLRPPPAPRTLSVIAEVNEPDPPDSDPPPIANDTAVD